MKKKKDYYLEALLKEHEYLMKTMKLAVRRSGLKAFALYEDIYKDLTDAMVDYLKYNEPWPKNKEYKK